MLQMRTTRLIVLFQLMLTLQMTNQELNYWLVHYVAKQEGYVEAEFVLDSQVWMH